MTPGALGREDLLALLQELADELAARGASATLFVVGGAAMSIAFDARRSTHDIDAAFEPSREVRAAAAAVAARHSLDEDWLNDGAKGFMPGTDRVRPWRSTRPRSGWGWRAPSTCSR